MGGRRNHWWPQVKTGADDLSGEARQRRDPVGCCESISQGRAVITVRDRSRGHPKGDRTSQPRTCHHHTPPAPERRAPPGPPIVAFCSDHCVTSAGSSSPTASNTPFPLIGGDVAYRLGRLSCDIVAPLG